MNIQTKFMIAVLQLLLLLVKRDTLKEYEPYTYNKQLNNVTSSTEQLIHEIYRRSK